MYGTVEDEVGGIVAEMSWYEYPIICAYRVS